jgi:hypothetical protein
VKSSPLLILVLALGSLYIGGCRSASPESQNPAQQTPRNPTSTPIPGSNLPTSASSPLPATPAAQTRAPQGEQWEEHEASGLSIRLPTSWRAEKVATAAAISPGFQHQNAELFGFLEGAGAEADAVFTAGNTAASPGRFVDNLTIRRAAEAGDGAEPMQQMAADIAAHYRQLGFDVEEAAAPADIGGLPTAFIVYTFRASSGDAEEAILTGLQALVLAPDDLWILTYTTESDRFAGLRPIFEESARSFRPK